MRDDQTIYRYNEQRRYGQQVEPERRPSFAAGAVVGILVTAAIVGAFVLGSGMFSRIVNKFVPANRPAAAQTQTQTQAQIQSQPNSEHQTYAPPEAPNPMLTGDEAINCAVAHVAGANNVRNAGAQLVTGGDAPHYVVDFDFDDAHYTVTVDAYNGDVWDVQTSFNGGEDPSGEQPVEEEESIVWDEAV